MTVGCLDVAYDDAASLACAALVAFKAWDDDGVDFDCVVASPVLAGYESGQLWKRELPPIQAVLAGAPRIPDILVVDGYVELDALGRPGLGAHLHAALGFRVPVIGIAKNPLATYPECATALRGRSERPLFVSARGVSVAEAVRAVERMSGCYRTPYHARRADRLCRDGLRAELARRSG